MFSLLFLFFNLFFNFTLCLALLFIVYCLITFWKLKIENKIHTYPWHFYGVSYNFFLTITTNYVNWLNLYIFRGRTLSKNRCAEISGVQKTNNQTIKFLPFSNDRRVSIWNIVLSHVTLPRDPPVSIFFPLLMSISCVSVYLSRNLRIFLN